MSHVESGPATSRYRLNPEVASDHTSAQWEDTEENRRFHMDLPASLQTPTAAAIFRSNTIAPSPPPGATLPNDHSNPSLDISSRLLATGTHGGTSSPLSAGLRIQTDIAQSANSNHTTRRPRESTHIPVPLRAMNMPLARTPSIKNLVSSSVGSYSNIGSAPGSAMSSPMLSAMADITPLPSPIMSGDSPGPWNNLGSRPTSRDAMVPITADSALVTANGESISAALANQSKRRAYHGLGTNAADSGMTNSQINKEKTSGGHTKNRSISEYVPEKGQVSKHVTVSGSYEPIDTPDSSLCVDAHMRREPHLAAQRGLEPTKRPPTPPSSRTGGESSDSDSSLSTDRLTRTKMSSKFEYFDARTRADSKLRRWRGLRVLGQGTFSRVILATSQAPEEDDKIDEIHDFGQPMDGIVTPVAETRYDDKLKKLVAIKICEHGPKGGASEERIEMSLKRELEIMELIHHPSLVHLKAWNIEETRAILVLSYCPGGDLFEFATQHESLVVPSLLRRMFAELVGAVRYLHDQHIVHRDIKLENVLVNLPPNELARPLDWTTYPYSIVTLTDLGLSRKVKDNEKLETRCGSDDYAAPEVIMGQHYDGRATDAWSLGVLLYTLLESRLPFDFDKKRPKLRSATSHRIARVEWYWCNYSGDEGEREGDTAKFRERGLEGAMIVTEGLIRRSRSRWTLPKVAEVEWVSGAINVEGGIRFRPEHIPEEVLR